MLCKRLSALIILLIITNIVQRPFLFSWLTLLPDMKPIFYSRFKKIFQFIASFK